MTTRWFFHPQGLKPQWLGLLAVALALLNGCSYAPSKTSAASPEPVIATPKASSPSPSTSTSPAPAPSLSQGPAPQAKVPSPTPPPVQTKSLARNHKEYRKDAASHLYGRQAHRIYKGRLPPMLQAVGVLNVDIDSLGGVKAVYWTRAPRHVPHVMAEIERMVKASAPYPVPQHLRQVTYTDVWLWHQSGQFQLDTLTEGQD